MKKNHWIWMVIGCGLPLLLIFLAPSLGIGDDYSLFIFIILMFGCHLLMPMHHHKHEKKDTDQTKDDNKHNH